MDQSIKRLAIDLPHGYDSREAASFVSQLDALSERMLRDLKSAAADDLAWQASPGMNTIGMLLTHIAIVEVYWISRVFEPAEDPEVRILDILGINGEADGLPLAKEGLPPNSLKRELAYFVDLLNNARAYSKRILQGRSEHMMEVEIPLPDAKKPTSATPRWTLFHILEHQAGHYGQMLLLEHLRLASTKASVTDHGG